MNTLTITNDDLDEDGFVLPDLLINIDEVVLIDCSWTNIRELPWGPNIERVSCHDCPFLEILPPWPNVRFVDCSYCPSLVALPSWPNIEEVICLECPLLRLPIWPDVKFMCKQEKIDRMIRLANTMGLLALSRNKKFNEDTLGEILRYNGRQYVARDFFELIFDDDDY